jgi:hypothetical protein
METLTGYSVVYEDTTGPREERWPPTEHGERASMARFVELFTTNPATAPTRKAVWEERK